MIRVTELEKKNDAITVHLSSEIPLEIFAYGKRPDDEYKNIVREQLQLETQTIFEHIQFLSSVENGYTQNFKVEDFKDILQTLSRIGKAFIDAQSDTELAINEAKRYPKRTTESGDSTSQAATLAEHTLQIMANKISHILQSDKITDEAKQAFQSIIFNAANEGNIGIDNPELIKLSLPLIINSLEFDYGKGIVHSLGFLLDSGIADSIEDELRQYEKRFDGTTEKSGLKAVNAMGAK